MDKRFQFRIYTSTGGIAHTITHDHIRTEPTVGGQTVYPLEGRTQSRPWQVEVDDRGDYFTVKLADSGGRMVLMNRLADVQVSVNGSSYQTIATGRISDIQDFVSHYAVSIDDERQIERAATVFRMAQATTYAVDNGTDGLYTGCNLIPPGPRDDYGNQETPSYKLGSGDIEAASNYTRLYVSRLKFGEAGFFVVPVGKAITSKIVADIRKDVIAEPLVDANSTAGNFHNLRARITSSTGTGDFEVAGFWSSPLYLFVGGAAELTRPLETLMADPDAANNLNVWVVTPPGSTIAGTVSQVVIAMTSGEPSEASPLLIGGATGINPFVLLKDLYDEIGVRYSTDLDTLAADPEFGVGWWRITAPQNLARFAEDHIYKPYGVVPFIDSDGQVAPRRIHLPRSSDVSDDVSTLTELTASNVAFPHPPWRHTAQGIVTRIRPKYTHERPIDASEIMAAKAPDDFGGDMLEVTEEEIRPREHDRITEMGTHEADVVFSGLHRAPDTVVSMFAPPVWGVDHFADIYAREVFDRVGDGPIFGSLSALSTAIDLEPGEFVRIDISTFPGSQGSRGDTRIVQIVGREWAPAGPDYEWYDAGPYLQPPNAPTVTLSSSTADPKHGIIAAISGFSSASTDAQWELATAISSTEPADASDLWRWRGLGDTTSHNIGANPAGQTIWAKARVAIPNRVRSAWSTAASQATASLTAPTGLGATGLTATSVDLEWTLGETNGIDGGIEVFLDQSATCPSSGLVTVRRGHWPGVESVTLEDLTADSTYCAAVRHIDIYGGYSTQTSTSFQTTTGTPVAPSLLGFELLVGSTD